VSALLELLGGQGSALRTIAIAILVAARVAPLTLLVPWLALRSTPVLLRSALLLALTAAMMPIALATTPALPDPDPISFAALAAREAAIGTVFAIVTAIPLHALDMAGRLIDAMRGAAQSEIATPSGDGSSPLGALHGMLGAVLFLALGGHRLVIAALGEGMVTVPPGSAIAAPELAELALGAARIVVAALALAVSFAAPAAVSLVVVEVGLGLAGRAAPQIPMHFAGMPLRAAIGIAAALLALSVLAPHLPSIFRSTIDAAALLIRDLAR
jgi:type III secretory pathway component EscT